MFTGRALHRPYLKPNYKILHLFRFKAFTVELNSRIKRMKRCDKSVACQHFLLFTAKFSRVSFVRVIPKRQILDSCKLKEFKDDTCKYRESSEKG